MSRAEKIVAAMDQKLDELVAERIALLDLVDYHQEVIDSGMHAIHNFYQKRKAQDRIVKINEELQPIEFWLRKGES